MYIIALNVYHFHIGNSILYVTVISIFLLTFWHTAPILTLGTAQVYYAPWKPQNPHACSPAPWTVRAHTSGRFDPLNAAAWHSHFGQRGRNSRESVTVLTAVADGCSGQRTLWQQW